MWQSRTVRMCEYIILEDLYGQVHFDESNGLWYELQGDYYILIDTFRRRNTAYRFVGTAPQAVSKEHKQFLYTTMLIEVH